MAFFAPQRGKAGPVVCSGCGKICRPSGGYIRSCTLCKEAKRKRKHLRKQRVKAVRRAYREGIPQRFATEEGGNESNV